MGDWLQRKPDQLLDANLLRDYTAMAHGDVLYAHHKPSRDDTR
ncbi:hypothetical protein [Burkholderia cepacia]|nr:hypothetical protein [Burkholderia cepacia]